jgi:hypothetical protein
MKREGRQLSPQEVVGREGEVGVSTDLYMCM